MGRIHVGAMWCEGLYSTRTDGMANVKQSAQSSTDPSHRKERVSQRHGHATHRLDPTQSDGCILQATGTAAAVEVVQHRQTADFKRHVWEMTQITLYQGQSVNLSPLQRLIARQALPLFILKFGLSYEGAIYCTTFKRSGNRCSTVVKVLRYKSEGRWYDSRWCHWNFSLT